MANQRREYEDFEQISLGFKAFGWQARAVHAAAVKAKVSTSLWLERVIVDHAAKELGTTVRELEPRAAGPGSAVRTTEPKNAAKVARVNASVVDLQAQLKQVQDALNALTAPTAPPKAGSSGVVTRRRR